jgi:hypothetical protein
MIVMSIVFHVRINTLPQTDLDINVENMCAYFKL